MSELDAIKQNVGKLTDDELQVLITHWEGADWDSEYERTQQRRRITVYRRELEKRNKKS